MDLDSPSQSESESNGVEHSDSDVSSVSASGRPHGHGRAIFLRAAAARAVAAPLRMRRSRSPLAGRACFLAVAGAHRMVEKLMRSNIMDLLGGCKQRENWNTRALIIVTIISWALLSVPNHYNITVW